MALVKCKECGGNVSNKAPVCPNCGAPQKKKTSAFTWLITIFLVVPFLLVVLGAIVSGGPDNSSSATEDASAVKFVADESKTTPTTKSNWQYDQTKDDMEGDTGQIAILGSSNRIQLDFPYREKNGNQLFIVLRKNKRYGENAILRMSKGNLMCSSLECKFRMKVGDDPIQTIDASPPDDHSADLMFVSNAKSFIEKLRTGEPIKIEVQFFQQGNHTFNFEPKGLEWPT